MSKQQIPPELEAILLPIIEGIEEVPFDRNDFTLIKKMADKLLEIWNDLDCNFCGTVCKSKTTCKEFSGACAIAIVKGVSNWGFRALFDRLQEQKHHTKKR